MIKQRGRYYTKNLVPGISVYGERLIKINGKEYREWDIRRSKLGAGIKKGLRNPIKENSKILYLGASTGTTVSHVSDIAFKGRVYAIEFAPEPIKHLIMLAMKRPNIIPILEDANHPERYPTEMVDVVFQDVAQRNQVEIFIKNCKAYLKKNGLGILVIKSRSIDVTKNPSIIFKRVDKEINKHFKVIKSTRLEPFEKDHKIYLVKPK